MSESNNFKFKPIPLPASKLSGGVPGTFYTVIVKREKLVAWWPRGVDGFRDEFKNSYDDHSIVSFVSMGGDGLINDLIYRFDEVGFVENRDYFLCDILTETLQWSRPRTPPWLFSWRMPEGIHFFRIEEGTEAPKPFNIEWITKKNETSL